MKIIVKTRFIIALAIASGVFCLLSCKTEEKDFSLTLDEYEKIGMPKSNRIWEPDDFLYANDVLGKFKWENPRQLPKKGSEKSGALFDRMVSMENLTFLQEDTLKLNEKALLLMNYLPIYENWRYIYTDVRLKVQYHHRELVDIQLFGLSIIELMLDYADKIQKSEDPVDMYLQSGDQNIREMYIGYILATLQMQEDITQYTREDMERMTDILNESITINKVWMNDDSKSKIRDGLNKVADNDSNAYAKELYVKLSESL